MNTNDLMKEYLANVGYSGNLNDSLNAFLQDNTSVRISDLFKNWRLATSAAKNNVRNAKLLLLGDSTFAGSGANGTAGYPAASNSRALGPQHQLATLFRGAGYNAYTDSSIGGQNAQAYYLWDTRFSAGAGWSSGATTGATLATTFNRPHYNNTTTNPLTFTPELDVDTFIVHYAVRTSAGSFTWSLDGGATTNVSVQAGANAVGSFTVTAGSVGEHVLSLARVTGSIYILAIQAYNSTLKGIDILHSGGSGNNMSNLQAVTNPWDALPFVKHLQPDLTIVNLAINNWILNVDLNLFRTQLQTSINYFKANNIDVIFVTGLPTQVDWVGPNGVISLAKQLQYVDTIKDACKANSIVCLDSFNRFGTQEKAFAEGFYTDYTHPNYSGYYDFMKLIFNFVSKI